jgi:hypothetical protein
MSTGAAAAAHYCTTATTTHNENVTQSRRGNSQSPRPCEGEVFVIYAAFGVGASCGIAEISITDTTAKRLKRRPIPELRCRWRVILVIPNETLNRC